MTDDPKFDLQKGIRCGNCIYYFCDNEDMCVNDNDMMAMDCTDFKSWNTEVKELKEKFIADLDKILKVINGGCPKVNTITEIFGMKEKWR